MTDQIGLFGAPPPAVRAASPSAQATALGAALPSTIRFGTSSWSFPGWRGLVWADDHPGATLAREGLPAYSQHPLLRAVGVDRSHYGPISQSEFARWADSVPDDFRFLVKAHEFCSLLRFPGHARYGARAGQDNALFLDPGYAIDAVIEPTVRGLGDKLGSLCFQFAPQSFGGVGGPLGFADRLHAFLDQLPPRVPLSVEVRNPELITPAYADALADVGVAHCHNLMERMPSVQAQARLTEAAAGDVFVARWMLVRGMDYGTAKAAFAPFDRLQSEDEPNRLSLAGAVANAHRAGREVLITVNNKAEGCAPESIRALAAAILRELDPE